MEIICNCFQSTINHLNLSKNQVESYDGDENVKIVGVEKVTEYNCVTHYKKTETIE